jgi:TonB family protein
VVHDHLNPIRYCYQRELQLHPDLAGRVVIRFEIDRSGSVSAATVASSTVDDPAVGQCVAGVFLRMRFEVTGSVGVTYPFDFEPE